MIMSEQCQHLNSKESYRLLTLLSKFEDMFDGTLGWWNNTPVDLELKDDANQYVRELIQYQGYTKRCSKINP